MHQIQTRTSPILNVGFGKTDDRWSHRIDLVNGDARAEEQPLLHSIEGTPEENWPPSPPLQEVSPHGETILLGVGMAGRSHWSCSCSIEEDDRILFDVACLVKASTGEPNLVVSYRVDDSVQSVEAIESGIRLTVGGEHPVVVQLTAGAAGEEGANDGGSDKKTGAKFAVTDRVVTIAPSQITESPTSAVRWSWSIKAQ